ncbi:MAG TPA: TIGR00282 family metallophosphoesterase [Nitrospinota bacterium]|nr:TIGR00282 family metallophosphoesterase [Nitrospinota bacterium]
MNILFIGDIVGKAGRRVISNLLYRIIDKYKIDFCIANCENAAGGFGITYDIVKQLLKEGIDVLTSGNHIWDKKEIYDFIDQGEPLIRPANYPDGTPGFGRIIRETASGQSIGVINLSGRVFIGDFDCPFRTADREIEFIKSKTDIIIVDFHAEATSEKMALGWYLDGRVSAVIGTHTHVQTADERILFKGTAYITDVGMTGPTYSVIGVKKEIAIERFLTQLPKRFETAKGESQCSAVILDINEKTGQCKDISRLQISYSD